MPLNAGPGAGAITNGDQTIPAASPHYRQRGLITTDEPSTGPVGRQPRGATRPIDDGARPSIQEMTNRRGENAHDGSGWSRAQMGSDAGNVRQGSNTSPAGHRDRGDASSTESRGTSRPTPSDNPRSSPGARSEPRSIEPRSSEPRSAPTPRAEAPARTSPPPERSAPRSEPAPKSEPASSGSKPPGKSSSN
jgi:hypothetical protein